MTPLHNVILNKKTDIKPIWIMRQAGRYLPEFREIRKQNPDFIKLCLNESSSTEITLQPLKRFNFDAAIIFSDILMLPYGLDQKVEFKKNFGPILGKLNIDEISQVKEIDFIKKISLKTFPELKFEKTSEWMGFRPTLPDSLPMIGEIQNTGIFTGFGHQHIGMTSGPKTGFILWFFS